MGFTVPFLGNPQALFIELHEVSIWSFWYVLARFYIDLILFVDEHEQVKREHGESDYSIAPDA